MNHQGKDCVPKHPVPDTITTLGRSLIQFGPLNNRVYLMKLDTGDLPGIVPELENLANGQGLTKICAKIPAKAQSSFVHRGFVQEARVPDFFHGREDGLYLAKFLDPARGQPDHTCPQPSMHTASSRGESAVYQAEQDPQPAPPAQISVRQLGLDRAGEIARIFARSFSAYPFPLHDLAYLRSCMHSHVCFFGVQAHGSLAALASTEMDEAAGYVEMTDFLTLPGFRGQGLAVLLLQTMEDEMRTRGFWTAFSIARAGSPGINSVFAGQGYAYRGRLVQNTRFNGMLEDMNVWSKRL